MAEKRLAHVMDHRKRNYQSCVHNFSMQSHERINSSWSCDFLRQVAFIGLTVLVILNCSGCATDDLAGLTTRDASDHSSGQISDQTKATKVDSTSVDPNHENVTRQLASSFALTDSKLEQSFTKLMNTPQAADYLNQEFSRLMAIDLLSNVYLADFDRLLNQTASKIDHFLENDAYASLLASHRLQSQAENRLGYFLFRALETKWSEDVRPEHKQAAIQLVEHFKYTLQRRREEFGSPVLRALAERFQTAQLSARVNYQSENSGTPRGEVAMDLSALVTEIKNTKAQSGNLEKYRKTSAEKMALAEIETLKMEIHAAWKTSNEARSRGEKISKIEPDAGISGSIDGQQFAENQWALTFDGGPSQQDEALLDLLSESHARATFFWNADHILDSTPLIQKAKAQQLTLGVQSFTGADLGQSEATPEKIHHEINDAVSLETKAYGSKPLLYRCASAACVGVDDVRSAVAEQKLVQVLWNVDGLDWIDHNTDSVYARIRKQMQLISHGIIIISDRGDAPSSQKIAIEVTRKILKDFAAPSQLHLVTVQESIDQLNHVPARTAR